MVAVTARLTSRCELLPRSLQSTFLPSGRAEMTVYSTDVQKKSHRGTSSGSGKLPVCSERVQEFCAARYPGALDSFLDLCHKAQHLSHRIRKLTSIGRQQNRVQRSLSTQDAGQPNKAEYGQKAELPELCAQESIHVERPHTVIFILCLASYVQMWHL